MTQVGSGFTLTAGTTENVAQVQSNFVDIRTVLNGNIDETNLTSATKNALGLSDSGTVRRGRSVIATSEAIAGTSYAALTTPDRVSSVVVPSNAVLWVSYWCQMIKTVGGASETASVGLFLNGTQVKSRFGTAPASGASGGLFETAGQLAAASTISAAVFTDYVDSGMAGTASTSGAPADDTTNGHPVGAFVPVVVAAGTYTVDVRFKKTAGATVSVSTRRLYVKAEAYA
jgi:hypothetical protein